MTLVNDSLNSYKRVILDEGVRGAFKSVLSETSKNNFLQLENTPEYESDLKNLYFEIIRCDEELQPELGDRVTANNVNAYNKRRGGCFICGKSGHKPVDCWYGQSKDKKPPFDKS